MTVLFAVVALLASPYIDLEFSLPLGAWRLDAPIADLAAAVTVLLVALRLTRARPPVLPGPAGYALVLLAGVLALPHALAPADSLHFLLRKPIFLWIAWGGAVAWVVAHELGRARLRWVLLAMVGLAAAVSLATSIGRIATGNALWFTPIEGLTNNHKTLAVAIAPVLPLLVAFRRGRIDLFVIAIAIAAITLSMSRTAWISAAVGLAYVAVWKGRTLASRRGLVAGVLAVGLTIAVYGPVLSGSNVQIDAARSRHSLDKRAWAMFAAEPWVGLGGGSNVIYEQQTFPDYRVNGVDAHGVFQKIGSELGLLGLFGYACFVGSLALRVRGAAIGPQGTATWASFVALHTNLLLSTETFSQTHWSMLAVVWGLTNLDEA